jgi:hypothetical protein
VEHGEVRGQGADGLPPEGDALPVEVVGQRLADPVGNVEIADLSVWTFSSTV